jgi:hypothetical protein
LEYRPDRFPEQPHAGPFCANTGGFLMCLLLGFTGLKMGRGPLVQWPRHTVVLPQGWGGIEVKRFLLRGRPAKLIAKQGQKARLEFV